MARKQSDYLASLLDEGEAQAPDTAPQALSRQAPSPARAGLSLLGRENALARVASGEVRQVTQLLLDPARVRIWDGNARIQAKLSEQSCRDLIDSILAEGGQKVPAVVRHLSDDPDHDYELIAGTRRHFAVSWLRAHSYPEMKLLAQVADLDDEAAFRLADIENRARKDISDIERARNYADAIDRHYGGRAVRMSERLKLSKGWLSKMLKAAAIPDTVLAAFANLHELTLNPAYKLATALDDKARAGAILAEAEAIAAENRAAIAAGAPPLPGTAVLRRLLAATSTPARRDQRSLQFEVSGSLGRTIMEVKGVTRHGVILHLPMGSGAADDHLLQALRDVLETLRLNGISVR
ncbi:chromosome partitioning protein, ParB family [Novosphingobium sp. CF614]|uniref:ParB/RepB/Spo0J family partition protein n=1 Tax=Novosphingobium sp. CF614 TaxID=1884364 RepID=UPI0008E9EFEE|nr:ParB/RepB/Spo0J family partition protein [Novosphingobium sp. CF614]SFG20878.1 chromosome partitioning protein, ParB family [Novosphingobium sp. CF614]